MNGHSVRLAVGAVAIAATATLWPAAWRQAVAGDLGSDPGPATGPTAAAVARPDAAGPGPAGGVKSAAAAADGALASGLYWYEHGRRRALIADDSTALEFAPDAPGRARLVPKSAPPGAPGAQRMPLLRDRPGGAPRALAGGVLVTLRGTPDETAALAQLRAAGLEPMRAIVGTRVWLVAAPAGLGALELANRLHESGRFEAAQPNWWRPPAHK